MNSEDDKNVSLKNIGKIYGQAPKWTLYINNRCYDEDIHEGPLGEIPLIWLNGEGSSTSECKQQGPYYTCTIKHSNKLIIMYLERFIDNLNKFGLNV